MHYDFKISSRESWKYEYKGSELVKYAEQKLEQFIKEEDASRTEMSRLLEDRSISLNNEEVNKVKIKVTFASEQAEQCRVYLHEFKRLSERMFNLSLGDVIYFGLIK